MVRDKSKASEKQTTEECKDRNEHSNIEKEDNPIVSREEADDDGKLDAESEESAEKESPKSEEINGVAVVVSKEGSKVQEEWVEEVWDITRVIPTAEEKIECRYNHCSKQAVAIWASNTDPEDKWWLCEKCQFEDFGGWPEGVEPVERSNNEKEIAVPPTLTTASGDSGAPNLITTICKTPPRTYSTKNKVDASIPAATDEPVITQDDSDDPEASEEKYELSSIVSLEKLRANPVKCSDENCTLPACSVWTSTTDPKKWYYCIDCQEKDFGGWPTSKELPCDHLSSEHLIAIATKCSKKRKPVMPVFASNCVTPNPSLSPKGRTTIPGGGKGENKQPTMKVSRAAVARHEKWQADAKKMGVNRIIVKKNEAKKVIFDALYDSFRPMSSENIYMMLKKMVPQPVVNAAVQDMSMKDDHVFGGSDDDDDDNVGASTKEKKSQKKEAYAGSLFFKAGRSAASSLYYVDHNKIKEMSFDEKRELSEKVANAKAEQDQLKFGLKELHTKTTQLLSQPTNHVLTERLGELENEVETLSKEVNDAKALTVNESHKKKLKRRIQSMAGHYRKRKQLCCSFLSSLEEISDGAISKKKCLKGDGQIALDSDETVNKAAIAYAKSKKRSKTKSGSLADENFVGVALDSQKMIKRVYVSED